MRTLTGMTMILAVGALQDGNCDAATDGADGIVVLRYDYDPTPPGLKTMIR